MTKLTDPLDGKEILKGPRGSTTTLRCKKDEDQTACIERHKAAGWPVPSNAKLIKGPNGPELEW